MSFVEQHDLWSAEQHAAIADIEARIAADGLKTVRLAFADQHGVLRGKTVVAADAINLFRSGCGISSTLLLKDTSNQTVFSVFDGDDATPAAFRGASDMLMVPDPTTFKALPWAPGTGWVLCDLHMPDGAPSALCSRNILKRSLADLADAGFDLMAGLEVELHVFRLVSEALGPSDAARPGMPGTPPQVGLLNQGYQYLAESRYDQLSPVFELIREGLQGLGLPLRSLEVEFGPSQIEFTFAPGIGLEVADTMVLFRSAVKQICRRNGYHATFMCRPRVANVMSSGWHLHQSLRCRHGGDNAFIGRGDAPLSDVALQYLAGLLKHARAAAAFSTPTINGYRRYRAYSLAPDRANWGHDNRGVMVRAIGRAGDPATRLENRVGEPAANPYLYLASQVISGLDGVRQGLTPPPSADLPYASQAPALPHSLEEALQALQADLHLCAGVGQDFVDCFLRIKGAELARFHQEVSEWEQREYFDLF